MSFLCNMIICSVLLTTANWTLARIPCRVWWRTLFSVNTTNHRCFYVLARKLRALFVVNFPRRRQAVWLGGRRPASMARDCANRRRILCETRKTGQGRRVLFNRRACVWRGGASPHCHLRIRPRRAFSSIESSLNCVRDDDIIPL